MMGGAEESEKSLILASDADALLATAVATALGRRWCTMRVGIRPCLLERMIDRETSALARASAHPLEQQQLGEQYMGPEGDGPAGAARRGSSPCDGFMRIDMKRNRYILTCARIEATSVAGRPAGGSA